MRKDQENTDKLITATIETEPSQANPQPREESSIGLVLLFALVQLMGFMYLLTEAMGKELMTNQMLDAMDFALFRNFFIGIFAIGLTKYKGQSFRRHGLLRRNWKMLALNGICGSISMALMNFSWMLLPLTICFVIICTLPFVTGLISHFLLGERMSLATFIAAVLSFGTIVFLSMSTDDDKESEEKQSYTFGNIVCSIALIAVAGIVLSIRQMQHVHSYLVLKSYNLIATALIGAFVLIRWVSTGQTPFAMLWNSSSTWMLLCSCVTHLSAQMLMFHVNQVAQPTLVSLMTYCGIVWRFLSDLLIFGLVPDTTQSVSIGVLVVIQVVYLVYQAVSQPSKAKANDVTKEDDSFVKTH